MGAKEAAKQTAALERGSGPAAAAVGDTRLWECAQMLPAPGNAPTSGAGSAGGRGDAQGEPRLRGACASFACSLCRVGLPTCAFTHPTQQPCIIAWGVSSRAGGAVAGLGHRGGDPKCAPLASEQPPALPIPVPAQGTCRCVVRRMRCHRPRSKERVTIPKVPHPWMELNGPLFPSKRVPAALPGAGSSGEGSGSPGPPAVPSGSGQGGFGAVKPRPSRQTLRHRARQPLGADCTARGRSFRALFASISLRGRPRSRAEMLSALPSAFALFLAFLSPPFLFF